MFYIKVKISFMIFLISYIRSVISFLYAYGLWISSASLLGFFFCSIHLILHSFPNTNSLIIIANIIIVQGLIVLICAGWVWDILFDFWLYIYFPQVYDLWFIHSTYIYWEYILLYILKIYHWAKWGRIPDILWLISQ